MSAFDDLVKEMGERANGKVCDACGTPYFLIERNRERLGKLLEEETERGKKIGRIDGEAKVIDMVLEDMKCIPEDEWGIRLRQRLESRRESLKGD